MADDEIEMACRSPSNSHSLTELPPPDNPQDHHHDDLHSGTAQAIPPADTGLRAWLVLAGCCLIQAPVWGFPLAFGVIQEYLSTHDDEFTGSSSDIASIGTSASGVMYLTSPLTFTLLTRYPRLRRWCGPVGLIVAAVGFLGSAFVGQIWQLIVLQGVVCSLGSGLLFTPTTLYLDEWFVRRKGLAYGIMWSSKSLVGVLIPFIVQAGLERFGYRVVSGAWAAFLILTSGPLLPFMKPRIPLPASSAPRPLSWSFLKSRSFWFLQTGNIMQSLGYFLPTTYLSSYAVRVGLSGTDGSVMIALLNATSIAGSLVFGSLSDRMSVSTVVAISAVGSVLSVLFFWGFAAEVGLLAVFSIAYGFFAGSYSTTWGGMLSEIKREDEAVETGLLFGMLAGGRGIGSVISGPLSSALLAAHWQTAKVGGGYSTEYGPIILFTGATALLGGWGFMQRWLAPRVR